MYSLVYVSDEATEFDDLALKQLAGAAAESNAVRRVTGYLSYKQGRFFQFLEGPEQAVRELLDHIRADTRHTIVRTLELGNTPARAFDRWHMRLLSGDNARDIQFEDLLESVMRSMASPHWDENATRQLVSGLVAKVARFREFAEPAPVPEHKLASAHQEPELVAIGIGASAGGLTPLEQFFQLIPTNLGAAFIVVQHLAPDAQTMMDVILERHTSMAVRIATDGAELEPNTVYVIPPSKNLEVRGNRFVISQQLRDTTPEFPIDIAFRSLADEFGERALGLILSGTGSDGSRGVRALRKAGGTVLVQAPDTANFSGMPDAAIASDAAHQVAPVEEITRFVTSYCLRLVDRQGADEHSDSDHTLIMRIAASLSDERVDFRQYKLETITRRIERRRLLTHSSSLADYAERVESSLEEREVLRNDMMISVTAFLRDPDAWAHLQNEVLPSLIEQLDDGETLRLWVAGCASGEEAYTAAMVVSETLLATGRRVEYKIFATDIDRKALGRASDGIYPEASLENVPPKWRQRYFERSRQGMMVLAKVREHVVFAPHNLVRDAPFTRLHFVSCRNVLIYMQPALQDQVLKRLHFGLCRDGVLMLGNADSLGSLGAEFAPDRRVLGVFRKRSGSEKFSEVATSAALPPLSQWRARSRHTMPATGNTAGKLQTAMSLLAHSESRTIVMVDEQRRVEIVLGDALRLLRVQPGAPSLLLTDLLPQGMGPTVTMALQRASRGQEPITFTNVPGDPHEATTYDLHVVASGARTNGAPGHTLMSIEARAATNERPLSQPTHAESSSRVEQLEAELQETREALQSVIHELETANEEQQTTNEELTASNQELQSTNEELQSVNQELYTVNFEYQAKIHELSDLTNDLDNLLETSGVGVIFLDGELCIRRYTPSSRIAMQILDSDIGRNISDLSHSLNYTEFIDDLQSVLATNTTLEREVSLEREGVVSLAIHPYRTDTGVAQGVVITVARRQS